MSEIYAAEQAAENRTASFEFPVGEPRIPYLLVRVTASGQWIRMIVDNKEWDRDFEPYFDLKSLDIHRQAYGTIDALTPEQEASRLASAGSITGKAIADMLYGSRGSGGAPAPAPAPHFEPDPGSNPASDQIGATAGQFRVDESGNATYSISIAAAAGTAGVAPGISLNYGSSGGPGIAGLGWSIGGLSAISRCRSTLGQDMGANAIKWTNADQFCLDGQRLLLVSGGHGGNGAVYRTEIDSATLVTVVGTINGGPDYFSVQRKDGSTTYYGKSPDNGDTSAKLNNLAGQTLTWAIRHSKDSVGNPVWFDYDTVGGAQRISNIKYAYGVNQNNPAASHGARINFAYATRLDPQSGYVAGHLFSNDQRLTTIRAYNTMGSEQLVREYKLRYGEGQNVTTDDTSRLTSVQECVGSVCLPKTTFEWREPILSGAYRVSAGFTMANSNHALAAHRPTDINGDGKLDLVWLELAGSTPRLNYAISNGTDFVQQSFDGSSSAYCPGTTLEICFGSVSGSPTMRLETFDYNADGRSDVAFFDHAAGYWKIYLAKPQGDGGWKLSASPQGSPAADGNLTSRKTKFADMNADGLVDALTINPGLFSSSLSIRYMEKSPGQPIESNHFYQFGAAESFSAGQYWNGNYISPVFHVELVPANADFNGDGRVDFMIVGDVSEGEPPCDPICPRGGASEEIRAVMVVTGDNSASKYIGLSSSIPEKRIYPVDINSDGLSDIVYAGASNQFFYVINKGNGSLETAVFLNEPTMGQNPVNGDPGPDDPQFTDWNLDGFPDLVWKLTENSTTNNQARIKIRYWNPDNGSFDPASVSPPMPFARKSKNESVLFTDMSGDGAPEMTRFNMDSSGEVKVVQQMVSVGSPTPANQAINRIETITNGFGASTYVTYEPLSDTSHYARLNVDTAIGQGEFCESEPGFTFCIPIPITVADPDSFYAALNGDWDLPAGTQTLGKYRPVLELNGPMPVVTRVEGDAPAAGADPGSVSDTSRNAIEYFYLEGKIQASGRGMLGFERLKTVDQQTGVQTTTAYRQDWPFIGYPRHTEVRSADGNLLSHSTSNWEFLEYTASSAATAEASGTAALGPIHPVNVQTNELAYDLLDNGANQGTLVSETITTNTYDAEANPDVVTITNNNGAGITNKSVTTDNNYFNTAALPRREARLSATTVTTTRLGEGTPHVRENSFTYFTSGDKRGLLHTATIEPNDPLYTWTTTHEYDEFGNSVRASKSGGGQTRCDVVTAVYDSRGRYVDQSYDCLGRKIGEIVTRNKFGAPLRSRNFLDTGGTYVENEVFYGALGREYFRRLPDGSFTKTYFTTDLQNCPAGTAYKSTIAESGGTQTQECFDRLGRPVRTVTIGFDGQWDARDAEYDLLGRIAFNSEPYDLPGSPLYWSRNSYDTLGRVTATVLPDNSDSTRTYTGLRTTTTNDLGHERTEVRNVLGEITEVVDNLGGRTKYEYNHIGKLRRTIDEENNEAEFSYDLLGRKVTSNDPDKGLWTYSYNHFGDLTFQTTANRDTSFMIYDGLGRMTYRRDQCYSAYTGNCAPYSRLRIESITVWNYDTAAYGLGQLASIIDYIGGYLKVLSYDDQGRLSQTQTVFDGESYYAKTTYDEFGRTFQVFDAAGDGSFQDNGIQHTYNGFGYPESLGDAVLIGGVPTTIYRTITAMNARGQITAETLGNGVGRTSVYDPATGRIDNILSLANSYDVQDLRYQWDTVGNLKRREEFSGNKSLTERFFYDGLNRLEEQRISGNSVFINYDSIGNITSKTGIGDYDYGAGSAGPHAVTSAGGETYTYDANGNNVSGDGRTIKYTTFDKPWYLALGKRHGGHRTTFAYGPDRARYKRTDRTGGGELTETRYVGSVEIIDRPDGTREKKRYIGGVVIETDFYDSNDTLTNSQTRYLHKDHLGSLDVISDTQGNIVTELSFDAWGQRRNAANWDALDNTQLVNFDHSITTRGFTGHEMLDELGIIHMNGRIYDPKLGRFLQADPLITDAFNPQNLNRYSYALNNPLNATDPTGFFLNKLFKALNKLLGNLAPYLGLILLAIPGVGAWATQSWINAFRFGFWTGGIGSGSLRGALIGGVSGAAFHGIGQKFSEASGFFKEGGLGHIGSHAATGGITSVLQGGKFGNGFLSAGLTKSANVNKLVPGSSSSIDTARTIIAATIGGTISRLTGGKFANGAITAAFGQAFNGNRSARRAAPSAADRTDAKLGRPVSLT
ncbi:MAG: FG-GAP-like repeat-containing protein, partial [Gammaproteobacteria bacterium]|nr:FG-GAP-like repeat-containing protein [Gammaproteobacteria bacterium]